MNSNVPMGNQKREEIDKADKELLVESAKEGDEQAFAHYGAAFAESLADIMNSLQTE